MQRNKKRAVLSGGGQTSFSGLQALCLVTFPSNVGEDTSGNEQSLVTTIVTSSDQFWDMILTVVLVHFIEPGCLIFLKNS